MRGKSTKSKRRATPRERAPKATGRPPVDIDPETVEGMASVGATIDEVATFLEVAHNTIERRFGPLFRKHGQGKKIKLRQAMLRSAIGTPARVLADGSVQPAIPPNPTIQVWLSKQWLGYSEKREVPVDGEGNPQRPLSTIEIFGRVIPFK